MCIEDIQKLLNSNRNYIKINTNLFKVMDTDEAILYSYLVPMFQKSLKQQDFRFFQEELFVPYKTELMEQKTGLSAFKQRNALDRLQKKKLLKVKLGQARTKFISINENSHILEKLLYGISLTTFEDCFFKCVEAFEEQAQKQKQDICIDKQYFINYLKNSDLFNNPSEIDVGWNTKSRESSRKADDVICI